MMHYLITFHHLELYYAYFPLSLNVLFKYNFSSLSFLVGYWDSFELVPLISSPSRIPLRDLRTAVLVSILGTVCYLCTSHSVNNYH